MMKFLSDNKDAFEALQSICTIFAFFVGGLWTWQTFVRKRVRFPSALLSHQVYGCAVGDHHHHVRVSVRIENKGESLLKVGSALVYLQRLSPCPEVAEQLSKGGNPVSDDDCEAGWPYAGEPIKKTYKTPHEIEPGESDELHFDFFVPHDVEAVLVYSHFANERKSVSRKSAQRQIGWNCSSIFRGLSEKQNA